MRKKLILLLSVAALTGILFIAVVNFSFSFITKSIAGGEEATHIINSSPSSRNNEDERKDATDVELESEKNSADRSQEKNQNTPLNIVPDATRKLEAQEETLKSEPGETFKASENKTEEKNKPTEEPLKEQPKDSPKAPTSSNYSATISKDKAEKVQESVTLREKAKIMTMLVSKLSASEIQLFTKMMGNGLSVEEKKEAKKIILNKLSEDEYNELIAIAAKYGLSQGKDYKDSLKEQHIVKNP
ncbi:hypothetical protein WMW72_03135 [Paenibacillus filicis]|uniref:Uncharacterized protein n=1 Tax=Paenibacillus filicis TaxID=669464 RepID=A0ABU9DDI1_9BACL